MARAPWIDRLKIPELEARPLRMERIAEEDTVRGMFMTSNLEVVRVLIGGPAVEQLRLDQGLETPEFAALGKYSLRAFIELQTAAARRIAEAVGGVEEGVARTAAAAVETFFESVAGRTMKLLAGKDPHRLMSAAPHGYSMAVADRGKRSYLKTGAQSGVFTFQADLLGPCHQIGVFETAIRLACDVTPTLVLEQSDVLDFKLLVSW